MKAYSELALLLSAPAAPAILRADALGGPRGGGGGRWRRIFSVSVEYLENTAPQPKDVERAEAVVVHREHAQHRQPQEPFTGVGVFHGDR